MIVRHHQDFAIGSQAMRDALNNLIGCLAGFRIQNFKLPAGGYCSGTRGRVVSVKDNRDGGAAGILVMSQFPDEFIPGGGAVTCLSRR